MHLFQRLTHRGHQGLHSSKRRLVSKKVDTENPSASQVAVVIGGHGSLGKTLVARIASANRKVFNIDFEPLSFVYKPEDNIKVPVYNITLSRTEPIAKQKERILEQLVEAGCLLHGNETKGSVDFVVSVAGSSAYPEEKVNEDKIFKSLSNHITANLEPALLASHISSLFGAPNGLLVLTGAASCLEPTSTLPYSLAYGASKAAVHFLAKSVSKDDLMNDRGIATICIMPHIIDTQHNRNMFPNEDVTTHTLPEEIANTIASWITDIPVGEEIKCVSDDQISRPKSGSMVTVKGSARSNTLEIKIV